SPGVMVTHVDEHQYGSMTMSFPVEVRQRPSEYTVVAAHDQRFGEHPIPVGAVINHQNGGDRVIPPTSNGRGISAPPMFHGGDGGMHEMPPRTHNPAQAAPNNPIYHRPQAPQQAPQVPVYHPGQNGGSVPNFPGHNGGGQNGNWPGNHNGNG